MGRIKARKGPNRKRGYKVSRDSEDGSEVPFWVSKAVYGPLFVAIGAMRGETEKGKQPDPTNRREMRAYGKALKAQHTQRVARDRRQGRSK